VCTFRLQGLGVIFALKLLQELVAILLLFEEAGIEDKTYPSATVGTKRFHYELAGVVLRETYYLTSIFNEVNPKGLWIEVHTFVGFRQMFLYLHENRMNSVFASKNLVILHVAHNLLSIERIKVEFIIALHPLEVEVVATLHLFGQNVEVEGFEDRLH